MIKLYEKPKVHAKLFKVGQTPNIWILTFTDPKNKFIQSIMISKQSGWETMATLWENLHKKWNNDLKEKEWKRGRAFV